MGVFLGFFGGLGGGFEAKPLDDDFTELHTDQISSFFVGRFFRIPPSNVSFFIFFVFSVLTHSAIRSFFFCFS